MYADDMKIFSKVSSYNDCLFLQKNLDLIVDRCIQNRLTINRDKCVVMTYGLSIELVYFEYKIRNNLLHRPETILDLGVFFDSKLSFVYYQ